MSSLEEMKRRQYQDYMLHAQQSALGQQTTMSPYANMQGMSRNPLEGYDIRNSSMKDLEAMILFLTKEYERRTLDTPLPSPTRRELQDNEALKNAYEALQIIMKLQGK